MQADGVLELGIWFHVGPTLEDSHRNKKSRRVVNAEAKLNAFPFSHIFNRRLE